MYVPTMEMNKSWTIVDEHVFLMNITILTDTYLWPVNTTYNITYHINQSLNVNSSMEDDFADTNIMFMTFTSIALGVVISATVVGNVFVIAAIFLERNLQTVGNGLVLSLAVADLMVACLVMPLGAVYEVRQEWALGPELCDVWTSCDVLCCTASILHLLAIAVDRYWAVTHVDYVRQRNIRHISVMIIIVWSVAFVVSFAPVFGWKDPDFLQRVEIEKRCLVSQDAAYQIFATCSTFYVPLVAIFVLYGRIYRVARKRIRNKPGSRTAPVLGKASKTTVSPVMTELTVITTTSSSHPSSEFNCATNGMTDHQDITAPILPRKKKKKRKECLELKREKKAAKTLAIITGVFVVCWLPFFVTALLMPLCQSCQPEDYVFSIFLWLGYANSMINPIIYTIFSPDFRNAFTRILCGAKRVTYRR